MISNPKFITKTYLEWRYIIKHLSDIDEKAGAFDFQWLEKHYGIKQITQINWSNVYLYKPVTFEISDSKTLVLSTIKYGVRVL